MKFRPKPSLSSIKGDKVYLVASLEFIKFKGFGKRILKSVDYNL